MRNRTVIQHIILLTLILLSSNLIAHDADLNGLYSPKNLKAVDWAKAEKITILFEDNNYEPDELSLIKGKPYIFDMQNVGERSHDFVDLLWFHNISVKQISSEFGRINTHHIHSLFLKKGHNMQVYFIPHDTGDFEFFCSLKGHREDGMEGFISIVESKK